MSKAKKRIIWISSLIALIILMICLYNCREMFKNCDSMAIKNYISNCGVMAPIVYILMFTFVPLTFFPDSVLAVAGGMAFGMCYGILYTLIGAVSGGTLAFLIARYFGRGVVSKLVNGKGKWFEDGVEKRGLLIITAFRLIPLVPFDIISYGAGLSKIRFKDFIFGTLVGVIPGVFIFINLGDKSSKFGSTQFIIAIALLFLLFAISFILKKKISFKKLQDDFIN